MNYLMMVIEVFSIPIVIVLGVIIWDRVKFMKSSYYAETGNRYRKTRSDKGLNGEYLTASILDRVPGYHKMLLNAYLLNRRNETTEVDLIFLHETGIYVIESKNYSGWIFGREGDRNWTQTFPNKKKQPFYNPIKQNQTHINAVKKALPYIPEDCFHSVIVFSERCELKKIIVQSSSIHVLKRDMLKTFMKKSVKKNGHQLSPEQIDEMYKRLKSFTHVSESVKADHVQRIKEKKEIAR